MPFSAAQCNEEKKNVVQLLKYYLLLKFSKNIEPFRSHVESGTLHCMMIDPLTFCRHCHPTSRP